MALTTTRELRWDDVGAPTLGPALSSFRTLLRDFLEDCGWSVEWNDDVAHKTVLRNSMAHGGSGCYVRILDDGSFTGGGRVARVDVYEYMADIDTGTGHAANGWVWKDRTGTGGPNAYAIFADERTFWGTTYVYGLTPPVSASASDASGDCCMFGGGDIAPAIPGDPGVFGAFPTLQNPSDYAWAPVATQSSITVCTPSGDGSLANFALSRTSANVMSPTPIGVIGCKTVDVHFGFGGSINCLFPTNPSPGLGKSVYLPAFSAGGGTLRGRLRGLFFPLNNWSGGGAHVGTVHDVFEYSGVSTLGCLAGCAYTETNGGYVSRLFVARDVSWDDV